jgi:hypothetical protein
MYRLKPVPFKSQIFNNPGSPIYSAGLMYGLKPVPFKSQIFNNPGSPFILRGSCTG